MNLPDLHTGNYRNGLALTVYVLVVGGAYLFLRRAFLPMNFEFWLGIVLLPLLATPRMHSPSRRYIVPTIAVLAATLLWYPSNSFLYAGAVGTLLLAVETLRGKQNWLLPATLFAISPFFYHFSNLWTFDLRLQLTELAVGLLDTIGLSTAARGNEILLDEQTFTVDEACAGLKMLGTSILLALMTAAHFEQQRRRITTLWGTALLAILAISLGIFANLNRILLLVLFNIPPEDIWHQILGTATVVFYVVGPTYVLLRFGFSFISKKITETEPKKRLPARQLWLLNGTACTLLFVAIIAQRDTLPTDNAMAVVRPAPEWRGRSFELDSSGVFRWTDARTLAILKPPVRSFQGTHDPRYCWRGTGFEFRAMRKRSIDGLECYFATIEREGQRFVTAWWLDNGEMATISEFDWRMRSARGEAPFWLVNLTGVSEAATEELVREFQGDNPLGAEW